MPNHTLRVRVANEIRAEMARQRKTGVQLAAALNCSQAAASRRMVGDVDISLNDLELIAAWLNVDINQLVRPLGESTNAAPSVA